MSTDLLTITPNPSLDLLHSTDQVVWDDANRVDPPRQRAGGQGINVARAALVLGMRPAVVATLAGATGDAIARTLADEGIPLHASEAPADTRTFCALRERATGRTLLINPRGPDHNPTSASQFRMLIEEAIESEKPAWVACCGSIPPGMDVVLYATAAGLARRAGALFVADCDGEALAAAEAAGCDLLVPNQYETERLLQMKIESSYTAIHAARALVARGTPTVIVTLGADGAVIATHDYAARASCGGELEGFAVGAGDALLAAVVRELVQNNSPAEILRSGIAAGTAVLLSQRSDIVTRTDYERIRAQVEIVEE